MQIKYFTLMHSPAKCLSMRRLAMRAYNRGNRI